MDATSTPPLPPLGSLVRTACSGHLLREESTPSIVFHRRRIYFCLPDCLESFKQNPRKSCLAGDPLLEEV